MSLRRQGPLCCNEMIYRAAPCPFLRPSALGSDAREELGLITIQKKLLANANTILYRVWATDAREPSIWPSVEYSLRV
jgi:hypothetical protein